MAVRAAVFGSAGTSLPAWANCGYAAQAGFVIRWDFEYLP